MTLVIVAREAHLVGGGEGTGGEGDGEGGGGDGGGGGGEGGGGGGEGRGVRWELASEIRGRKIA